VNVTLVSMVYPHPRAGFWPGIERQVGDFARALRDAGASVTVITSFRNGGVEREVHEGIELRRVPDSGQRGRLGHLLNRHVRSLGRNALALTGVIERSDVIESFVPLPRAGVLERPGLGVFAFFAHRDRPSRWVDYLHQPVHFRMEKEFFGRVRKVIVASSESRRVLAREYGVPDEKIVVIPLGVAPLFLGGGGDPGAAPARRGERLLYVGPLIRRKGLRTLIAALAMLRGAGRAFRLVVAGRGPDEPALRALASRLGVADAIEFAGYVPEGRLPALYAGADLFVFPSFKEGFGLVLVEAMACGLPVVASSAQPIPEVVGEAGRFFTPGDPAALAGVLGAVMGDPDLRATMRHEGLKRVRERYDWSRIAERTLEVYKGGRAA